MSYLDAASAARIAAALHALDQEIAAAGVPVDLRDALIIQLAARRWDERMRSERTAQWQRDGGPPPARPTSDVAPAGRQRRRGAR
jgi:hypothetical protein